MSWKIDKKDNKLIKLKKFNVKPIGVPNMPKIGKMGMQYPKRYGKVFNRSDRLVAVSGFMDSEVNEERWPHGLVQ